MSSIAPSRTFILTDSWLDDPIMKGLRDGTLSWADAAEMEGLFAIEASPPPSPPRAVSPARECPGAPTKPRVNFASQLRSYAEAPRSYAEAPRSYAEAPRSYAEAPRSYAEAPRSYAEAPRPTPIPSYTVGIRTIMARNLPRFVTADILRSTFAKYGTIKDIYIPKNMDQSSQYFGTLKGFALIKYALATESAAAFDGEYGQLTIGRNQIAVEFAKADR